LIHQEARLSSADADRELTHITQLLALAGSGDELAWNSVVAKLYQPLRALARAQLRGQQHTLDTTSLVHEWYLQLRGADTLQIHNRGHFLALAARVMRQVMSTYAKRRLSAKRGSGAPTLEAAQHAELLDAQAEQFVLLDAALEALSKSEPMLAELVQYRFYVGLSEQETADAMQISVRSVQRAWAKARALLLEEAT
jgi:RNA polymerase sigma factor (TIGR02999 family)